MPYYHKRTYRNIRIGAPMPDAGATAHYKGLPVRKPSNSHFSSGLPARKNIYLKKPDEKFEVDGKSFADLKKECLAQNRLFEDPEFPAQDSSLFFSQRPKMRFSWKRPSDICAEPQLFVGGASRFDVMQGELGDCWLLAAISSLSLNDELLYRIIPSDQSFAKGDYCGMFHFQFWQYGAWVDVIIDDRLPTYKGQLVYLHSEEGNEFWSALLEKAYAKLNGSYEALRGGSASEAMEDFTGGVTELIELNSPPKGLYKIMERSLKKGALMGCAIETQNPNQREVKLGNGLLMGHAYSITGMEELGNGAKLIRIRNPWGQVEWNGAWSDSSELWDSVPGEKDRLDVEFSEDGEFWMSLHDFMRNFTKLEICNLGPDALDEDETSTWVASNHEGRWIRGCSAGGCRNFPDTFWINPQFRLTLQEEDDKDPDDDEIGCSFIVSLLQKNRRRQKSKGQNLLTIGFAIYELKEARPEDEPLKKDFFLYNQSVARSKNFINLRENSQRFQLPPGNYVIVPSTFAANEEADFLLRIYTEKRHQTNELDTKTEQKECIHQTPPEEEEYENAQKFKMLFNQLTGEDGEIDAFELQDIINTVMKKNAKAGTFKGFSLEACRSMVALTDATKSGKLDYDEFKTLWVVVRKWIHAFKMFDRDGNGTFDLYELRNALSDAGYSLSSRLYQMLCVRYASENLQISLDDFVLLSVRLESMFMAYNEFKDDQTNKASLNLDEWLMTCMYS